MNGIIQQMISKYNSNTLEERKNSIKEVLQEVILCGLSRANFFDYAAFYGGTALRIFHHLDRFSEDLDFSLISKNSAFSLESFFPILKKELESLGLAFTIEEKVKNIDSNIKSAFLKSNTKELYLSIYEDKVNAEKIVFNELIKIKFEVDVNPPMYGNFEYKYGLLPSPYQVRLYDLPSLFAGKLHAIICRTWKDRVKGRDLYDFVFFMQRDTKVNLKHLNARLIDSSFTHEEKSLEEIKEILINKFNVISFAEARKDVEAFINDKSILNFYDKEFFVSLVDKLKEE